MIEDSQVEDALSILKKEKEKAMKKGKEYSLMKYIRIKSMVSQVTDPKDKELRTACNGFFRIRQRSEKFYDEYYKYMLRCKKDKELTFEKVLKHLYEKVEKVEASFASKLLSLINPDMPVYDSIVINNLKTYEKIDIKTAWHSDYKKRIKRRVAAYEQIRDWYDNLLKPARKKKWIELFDKSFPEFKDKISDVKKIDLILWKIRPLVKATI